MNRATLTVEPKWSPVLIGESVTLKYQQQIRISTGVEEREKTDPYHNSATLLHAASAPSAHPTLECTGVGLNLERAAILLTSQRAVNGLVILDSPVHPVTEGGPLTLHCLHRDPKPSNLPAELYKEGSLLQTPTTGEMTIRTVSNGEARAAPTGSLRSYRCSSMLYVLFHLVSTSEIILRTGLPICFCTCVSVSFAVVLVLK
ncbi:hypothetical protein AOLI_G00105660 [Acnodon oligacanthus]